MNPVTWGAIYLMIWWITFFAILPLWNRTPVEEGTEVIKGNDPGAPITHNLWKKVRINSLIAFGIWVVAIVVMTFGHIHLPSLPDQ